MRGGDGGDGGGDDTPVFTLLVRVFIPSFGRKNEVKQGGLDLEGGGLMRRLGRLMSGVWRKVPGFSRSTKETGGVSREGGIYEQLMAFRPYGHVRRANLIQASRVNDALVMRCTVVLLAIRPCGYLLFSSSRKVGSRILSVFLAFTAVKGY